jgi:NAD-dependent SIR2 family protein deacetylase
MQDVHAAAAAAVRSAGALVITAGAGMGVDSGLPDFRGDQGFWKAYPPYERLGISFTDAANPAHFEGDAAFGWGFYGHRARLYRETTPHAGFALLQTWTERFGLPSFVVTSNVDGQFQKAGFAPDRVYEVHGSIHHLQCTEPCSGTIWPNGEDVPVDEATMRARRIPRCPRCRAVARPNVLMFGDGAWIEARSATQHARLDAWLDDHGDGHLVVIELGAGSAIPTIRWHSEQLGRRPGATVVRVNPREPEIRAPHLSIASGAREALERIDEAL